MSGILTGKYNDTIPDGSRMTQPGYDWLKDRLKTHHESGVIDKVRSLTEFAQAELNCSMTQLALAWCVKNPHVSTVLLGATKTEQLHENLGAIEVVHRLTERHMQDIDAILDNRPEPYGGYRGAGMRTIDSV